MKNSKIKYKLALYLMASIFIGIVSSCSTNDTDDALTAAPVITSVSKAEEGDLAPTSIGYANNMYIIRGSGFMGLEKIYINDTDTYFNPTLVTDSSIFVTVDEDTPYENVSDEIMLVTSSGSVAYHFVIAPPAPQILRGFNPVNANEGDEVTIYGNFFLDPIVTFGTTEAEVISSTLTEIVVKTPAGADKQYVTVTTISGSVTSTYAVGTALYDDIWYFGWDVEPWNNHTYHTDTTAAQGTTYYKKEMGAWDNIQGNWLWDDQLADYAGIRISIKGPDGGMLKLVFNSNWEANPPIFDVTPEWQEYTFTWEELLNADHVQNITFQEFTGNGGEYYFDNIGYILKE
ncbi:MAG: IPT/TIG domain-containing protein [Bacteroidota bacterium]|uniref:IPT/TIG domain-containing protein n=1 Tax=Flagellimonas profundi TaxID=2915620 RepID=A0ABS3FL61_9FLAO|nr:IPT/TIG domain-containing protein [Allomuricauda profundi]MBO0343450.1 IPT/TIG domain-containing protein [Allomuricauda profundi]MEC7772318.1 IPT/TIG domain-containing protein [Bacteroidota bacterium]